MAVLRFCLSGRWPKPGKTSQDSGWFQVQSALFLQCLCLHHAPASLPITSCCSSMCHVTQLNGTCSKGSSLAQLPRRPPRTASPWPSTQHFLFLNLSLFSDLGWQMPSKSPFIVLSLNWLEWLPRQPLHQCCTCAPSGLGFVFFGGGVSSPKF